MLFRSDQVRLTVPCLFCEQEHTVSCSTAAFLQEKTLAFSCATSGLDCCYVGEEGSVFAAMRRLEVTVDVLESEAGRQTFKIQRTHVNFSHRHEKSRSGF